MLKSCKNSDLINMVIPYKEKQILDNILIGSILKKVIKGDPLKKLMPIEKYTKCENLTMKELN